MHTEWPMGWLELAAEALVGITALVVLATLVLLGVQGIILLRNPRAFQRRRGRRCRSS